MTIVKEFKTNKLKVITYETRVQMGEAAARDVARKIIELLFGQEFVNIIFAAAPSQSEFLFYLAREKEIDWNRINGFHMDEYVNLPEQAPQRFGNFLKEHIFSKVSLNEVYYINGNAVDLPAECNRYGQLLLQYPADIVCMGIGENTHIAFNDPHIADFNDPAMVKIVDLDDMSRQQQVNDGCFNQLEEVPVSALTLSVPALLGAKFISCVVPGLKKARAVFHTINSEVNEEYPSTALRNHFNAILYLDKESASEL